MARSVESHVHILRHYGFDGAAEFIMQDSHPVSQALERYQYLREVNHLLLSVLKGAWCAHWTRDAVLPLVAQASNALDQCLEDLRPVSQSPVPRRRQLVGQSRVSRQREHHRVYDESRGNELSTLTSLAETLIGGVFGSNEPLQWVVTQAVLQNETKIDLMPVVCAVFDHCDVVGAYMMDLLATSISLCTTSQIPGPLLELAERCFAREAVSSAKASRDSIAAQSVEGATHATVFAAEPSGPRVPPARTGGDTTAQKGPLYGVPSFAGATRALRGIETELRFLSQGHRALSRVLPKLQVYALKQRPMANVTGAKLPSLLDLAAQSDRSFAMGVMQEYQDTTVALEEGMVMAQMVQQEQMRFRSKAELTFRSRLPSMGATVTTSEYLRGVDPRHIAVTEINALLERIHELDDSITTAIHDTELRMAMSEFTDPSITDATLRRTRYCGQENETPLIAGVKYLPTPRSLGLPCLLPLSSPDPHAYWRPSSPLPADSTTALTDYTSEKWIPAWLTTAAHQAIGSRNRSVGDPLIPRRISQLLATIEDDSLAIDALDRALDTQLAEIRLLLGENTVSTVGVDLSYGTAAV
eukprot:Clim_evm3s64 gene=Clim_evmTU3s64